MHAFKVHTKTEIKIFLGAHLLLSWYRKLISFWWSICIVKTSFHLIIPCKIIIKYDLTQRTKLIPRMKMLNPGFSLPQGTSQCHHSLRELEGVGDGIQFPPNWSFQLTHCTPYFPEIFSYKLNFRATTQPLTPHIRQMPYMYIFMSAKEQ